MEDKEVEYLIDKKVAEAKLEVVEKRLQITVWSLGILLTILAAVFGVIIPLSSSNRNTEKVDNQVRWMQDEAKNMRKELDSNLKEINNDFRTQLSSGLTTISNNADKTLKETKEQAQSLIGQQLEKPELTCRFNGEEINGKTINVYGIENWPSMFEIFNKGKATARNVKLVLYQKDDSKLNIYTEQPWKTRGVSEEKGFARSFNYEAYSSKLDIVDPQYPAQLESGISFSDDIKEVKEELLLKIYYGQPEPTKVNFVIEKKQKK